MSSVAPDLNLTRSFGELAEKLPHLPKVVRYFDDFSNITRSVLDIENADFVTLYLDGQKNNIYFEDLGYVKNLYKHIFVEWINKFDPTTVVNINSGIRKYVLRCGVNSIAKLILSTPSSVGSQWNSCVRSNIAADEGYALRAMLHSLCLLNIGHWSRPASSIIRSLRGPRVDKYRVVRTGDCFLSLDNQASIINYIDNLCAEPASGLGKLEDTALRDACLLVLSFQYAFRPGQIARVEIADVRLFSTGAVHIAISLIKQQDHNKRIRVTRRIKREWGPLFRELVKRRTCGAPEPEKGVPPRLLFGLTPQGVRLAVVELSEELTGEGWLPTDLRHTAAQRLADGGISHMGLTEFLGHTSDRTANVYFDTSPSQAQRINEALAISPIYSKLASIAKTKTINKSMLISLPEDQQIGAVPHGVPISGIGACNLGQSLCVKNPVLACYTCSRFMPLGEARIHTEVLESLRPVVTEFAAASRGDQHSPAYAQLMGTIHAVRLVVEELKATLAE